MLDVIEHLPMVRSTFELLQKACRPSSIVVITTGDWGSLVARIMKKHWRLMTPPQHLSFFEPKTIRLLLESTGFEVLQIQKPWKRVPLNLAVYQLTRRLGIQMMQTAGIGSFGIPVNLFDAMRVTARRLP